MPPFLLYLPRKRDTHSIQSYSTSLALLDDSGDEGLFSLSSFEPSLKRKDDMTKWLSWQTEAIVPLHHLSPSTNSSNDKSKRDTHNRWKSNNSTTIIIFRLQLRRHKRHFLLGKRSSSLLSEVLWYISLGTLHTPQDSRKSYDDPFLESATSLTRRKDIKKDTRKKVILWCIFAFSSYFLDCSNVIPVFHPPDDTWLAVSTLIMDTSLKTQ